MVLYNSPLAVAALLAGLGIAAIGVVRVVRAYRAPSSGPHPSEHGRARDAAGLSPVLRDVLRSGLIDTILAIVGTLIFVVALVVAVSRDLSP